MTTAKSTFCRRKVTLKLFPCAAHNLEVLISWNHLRTWRELSVQCSVLPKYHFLSIPFTLPKTNRIAPKNVQFKGDNHPCSVLSFREGPTAWSNRWPKTHPRSHRKVQSLGELLGLDMEMVTTDDEDQQKNDVFVSRCNMSLYLDYTLVFWCICKESKHIKNANAYRYYNKHVHYL